MNHAMSNGDNLQRDSFLWMQLGRNSGLQISAIRVHTFMNAELIVSRLVSRLNYGRYLPIDFDEIWMIMLVS